MEKLFYTVPEFCAAYGVSRSKLYLMWKEEEGPLRIKIGSRTLIGKADANDWASSLPRINPASPLSIIDADVPSVEPVHRKPIKETPEKSRKKSSGTQLGLKANMPKKKRRRSFDVEFISDIPVKKAR